MIDLEKRREVLRAADAETVKKIRILGYYIDGLAVDEICEKLNIPEPMVCYFLQQFSVFGIGAFNFRNTVPPEYYTRDYYLSACGGYEEFLASGGEKLCPRLQEIFNLADIEPGMKVLDIGCGRGELVLHAALKGAWAVGIDYSENAVKIGTGLRASQPDEVRQKMSFQAANACYLPMVSATFDIVFMADVVEHLYPEELEKAMGAAFGVLKPGGLLVIHTPNHWYAKYEGVILRGLWQFLRGQKLSRDIPTPWVAEMHVNVQSPYSLRKSLRKVGFSCKIWTRRSSYSHVLYRLAMSIYPTSLIFGDKLYAIGRKPS